MLLSILHKDNKVKHYNYCVDNKNSTKNIKYMTDTFTYISLNTDKKHQLD